MNSLDSVGGRGSICGRVTYFDHNATSPLSEVAGLAWLSAVADYPGNPSSPHRLGARAEVALSEARQKIAAHLQCSHFDIVWTSGATEANNAVFHHASKNSVVGACISAVEHPSVLAAANRWFGRNLRLLNVDRDGVLDLNYLSDQLKRERPGIVAVMAANNETGVLQPWKEAVKLCREIGVPFACDAAQWIGKLPAAGLGECDFVTGCAHKFGGPLGIGFVKVPAGFQPLLVGGPQEESRRAGTENLPAAIAMEAGWSEREKQIASGELQAKLRLRESFIKELCDAIPGVEILGAGAERLWNTVAVLMPKMADCRRRWVVQLDKLEFAVSTGSACSSGKEKTSHVLAAMQRDGGGDRMLRFSSGWDTTARDWRRLLKAIKAAHAERNQTA
jgi:cysteine desulfurase